MQANRPDVVVTPNGILEMGAVYQAARSWISRSSPMSSASNGRIWLARNGEVMRQETDELWQAQKDRPLTESQLQKTRELYASRQRADLWENFSRRWQGQTSQGGAEARRALGLDPDRPIVLLAANVIGDSLTLGRQVFTESMTEWLERTVLQFAARPQARLVNASIPERYTQGPSVADVVRRVLPELRGTFTW